MICFQYRIWVAVAPQIWVVLPPVRLCEFGLAATLPILKTQTDSVYTVRDSRIGLIKIWLDMQNIEHDFLKRC